MNAGKSIRLKHIFRDDGKAVIVAMDHSMGGKVPGLEDYLATVKKVAAGGADAILIGYGNMLTLADDLPRTLGWIVNIPYPSRPEFVQEAAKAGADALKFTHFGGLRDPNLHALQPIAAACEEHGIVFMPEVVPQDENRNLLPDQVVSAARLGQERGGDFIKTAYSGSVESFKESIDAGGAGTCMGRNMFQHKDPTAVVAALVKIVHEGASVDEAYKLIS